jgi:hypothetical protein
MRARWVCGLAAILGGLSAGGCGLAQACTQHDRPISYEKQEQALRGYGYDCGKRDSGAYGSTYPDLDPCKAPDALLWGLVSPGD